MDSKLMAIIIGMALVTFITRIGAQLIFANTGIPAWLERWLKHVPTAFLAALIVPAIILPKGYLDITFSNSYLIAGIIASFIAYKTKNVLATIFIGMAIMLYLSN
ncbi:AzlD domain-containing protein [Alkaliphilus pronyensis]|uniref:AzlD domain-containing protein n=1 Tax=Alkaliphilus pronyensis TaxID=1482732 RepID=A0A6I0F805_9FIRM|nr:AzlD domain-containing protein [Alkaliphilus pronyensis]KAB3530675.1 AzlD domain-containing protein [Alkaliphilus pronyensis]